MHNTTRFVALVLPLLAATELAAQRLIALDSGRALSKVDPATGARTAIGTVNAAAGTTAGLTLNPNTGAVYLTSTSTDSIRPLPERAQLSNTWTCPSGPGCRCPRST